MSSLQSLDPRGSAAMPPRVRGALVLGALVAVLVITAVMQPVRHLTRPVRPLNAAQAAYLPLIQYRGTGASPHAPSLRITTGAPRTTGLLRAEHSYGALP